MLQVRHDLGFTGESFQGAGLPSEFIRQKFQRVRALQGGVLNLIHLAHPAAAEQADDAVLAKGGAGLEGVRLVRRGGYQPCPP